MANHRLSLEIPETLSACIFRVQDTSSYFVDMPVNCPRLKISVPGFSQSIYVDNVNSEFSLNLTACELKIQKDNCGRIFNDLPDGIYIVEYSVSPNDTVFVSYNHLRVTKLLSKLKALYCELDLDNCEPSTQKKNMQEDAKTIRLYLDAAKSEVEICRSSKKGLELYKKAAQMLDKYNCRGCK